MMGEHRDRFYSESLSDAQRFTPRIPELVDSINLQASGSVE